MDDISKSTHDENGDIHNNGDTHNDVSGRPHILWPIGKLLIAASLLAGQLLAAQVSFGVTIGPPPPPRVYVRPPAPGPGFVWVDGYWYPVGHRYKWHAGYWTRPPYAGAVWVMPHHDGRQFFEGYWEGDRGRVAHDHHWDRDRDRDFHDHGRD